MAMQSVLGLVVFLGVAWLASENRRNISARTVLVGLGLQFLFALLLLKLPFVRQALLALNGVITSLDEATTAGASFVFGYLAGGPAPFEEIAPVASYILAFRGLPLVLVVSALSSLLFYWKLLPRFVRAFSWVLQRTFGVGGAEGVGVAANVFVGMIEAPLLIRPYFSRLTRSELFTLMTCGMATIAGTVMVLYASILSEEIPNALGHILTASIISAPAAIMIAKIMVPESGEPTAGDLTVVDDARSSMDAITKGTLQGVQLLISIVAMLVVLVALVHLANVVLGLLPNWQGAPVTLQRSLGYLMAPVVWLIGIPWQESVAAGALMGTKTVLNELLAYLDMTRLSEAELGPKSRIILTYALCGFANPGSLGIMIGGLGTMAPERRDEIVSLGFRSIVAGTLATSMTGAVVALLV